MKILTDIPLRKKDYNAIGEAVTLLTAQFPVEHVILFGSKARGDDDEYSDIDLFLEKSEEFVKNMEVLVSSETTL